MRLFGPVCYMGRMKCEKTQPGNPHELSVNQHVIPACSLARFADADGFVQVKSVKAAEILRLRPDNRFFTLRRVWDQRAEAGWMKKIEDRFQALVEDVLIGKVEFITGDDAWTVTHYFSLWYWRSRVQPPDETEQQFAGLTGETLTRDQEEHFEKMNVMFVRAGGRMPARFLTGIQLQTRVDQYAHQLVTGWDWGVIQAQEGEFLMPDVPHHTMLPIAPKVLFAAHNPNGTIVKSNVLAINTGFVAYTWSYFIARDIAVAMDGITDRDIQREVIERDRRMAAGELHGPISAVG